MGLPSGVSSAPREVYVRGPRLLLAAAAAGLVVALVTYIDPAPVRGGSFDPFDPKALQDRMWFGDEVTRSEWTGFVNYFSAIGYMIAAASAYGRVPLGRVSRTAMGAMAGGVVGLGALVLLMAGDPKSFPLGAGMSPILVSHGAGLTGAWWIRARALRAAR